MFLKGDQKSYQIKSYDLISTNPVIQPLPITVNLTLFSTHSNEMCCFTQFLENTFQIFFILSFFRFCYSHSHFSTYRSTLFNSTLDRKTQSQQKPLHMLVSIQDTITDPRFELLALFQVILRIGPVITILARHQISPEILGMLR